LGNQVEREEKEWKSEIQGKRKENRKCVCKHSGNEPVYPKGDNMGENIGNDLGGKNLNLRYFFM
jgi:hypothetical protein